MNKQNQHNQCRQRNARWRHFDNKSFAVFRSIKREVSIGVLSVATLACGTVLNVQAQETVERKQMQQYALDEIEVTASRTPLQELQAARPVTVLSRQDIQAAAVQSINDLLKYAVGVDVRQRGAFGVQTDISLRGGTFDQVTILLNGINITNAMTGHLSADFPVAMEDVERIEVLEGPAARLFGTSAFSGAINIVTRAAKQSGVTLRALAGEHGLYKTGASVSQVGKHMQHQVSASYGRSDGAVENSDFQQRKLYYQGHHDNELFDADWQAGVSSQDFGANTFYTAKYANQFETTRQYYASAKAKTNKGWIKLAPSFSFQRTNDHYVLMRTNPAAYQNFHRLDVFGHGLNAFLESSLGKTSAGYDIRWEEIYSTSLGKPLGEGHEKKVHGEDAHYTKHDFRRNYSAFFEHNIILDKATISLGVMANNNSALDNGLDFYPGVDVSYRPTNQWRLFASWNKALRMPTFIDLYYNSPTSEGNVGLQPEKTEAFSIGAEYRSEIFSGRVDAFYNKGKDMIDWVMYSADDAYHAAGFELDNMGFSVHTTTRFQDLLPNQHVLKSFKLGYSYIHQKRHDDTPIYKSNYALQYLRHKVVANLGMQFMPGFTGNIAYRFQERMGQYIAFDADTHTSTGHLADYKPYGVVDLKVQYAWKKWTLFGEASNIFDVDVVDLGNIPQPGRWMKAGVSYTINW